MTPEPDLIRSFQVDIVDEDDSYVAVLGRWLTEKRCRVNSYRSPEDFDWHSRDRDAVLIEPCPNGVPRLDVISRLVRASASARVIALTAYPSFSLAFACARAGMHAYLPRPAPPQMVWDALLGEHWSPSHCCNGLSLRQLEHEYISLLLSACRGNVSATARRLGVRRSTLQRKLRKHPDVWLSRDPVAQIPTRPGLHRGRS
jgi:two-component system response regulator RegA